jgi:TonB-dependent receptor
VPSSLNIAFARFTPLALAASALLSNSAWGQTAADAQRIEVTGSYARSIEAAQALKRNAPYSLDAVNAEDIGKFPAQNAAEAIQLITGVTITRQRGEGLFVSVRGLGPRFQNVTLNGRSMATNDLIENGGVQGRSFRFEVLPSEFISQIEVVKTPTVDMIDGAIGGNIDVKTLRPLDVGSRSTFSLRGAYNGLTTKTTPTASGLYSWVSDDRTLGLLASGMYSERKVRNDRFMGFGWNLDRFSGSLGPLPAGLYTPTRTRPTVELEDRDRTSAAISLQWKPSKAWETSFDLLYTKLNVKYDEYGMDIYPDDRTFRAPAFVGGSQVVSGDTVVAGTINNVRWMASRESSMNRHNLTAVGLKQTWKEDGWLASADLAHSKAHSYHPTIQDATLRSRAAYYGPLNFDYRGGYTSMPTLTTNKSLSDFNNFVGQAYDITPKNSLDTDTSLRLDLGKSFANGWLSSVSGGLQAQRRMREYKRRDWVLNNLLDQPLTAGYFEPMPITDFLSGVSGNAPRTWTSPNADAFYKALVTDAVLSQPLSAGDLRNSFKVTERTQTAHIRADFDTQLGGLPTTANVGLRYARTQQTSAGYQTVGAVSSPVSFDKTYDALLPSLNLRLEISPTLVGRAAASRVISRPNVVDVAPRLTVSRDTPDASGGNPNLEPFMATMADAGLEWYFSKNGSASAAVFYKKFDDFITRQNSIIDVPGRGAVTLASSINGGNASLMGVELAYQQLFKSLPAPFDGLGMQVSVTAVDVKANYLAGTRALVNEISGLSKLSANLVGFYERGDFSTRLGYFWRDKYLNNTGSTTQSPSTRAAFGSLDGQINYQITRDVGVYIEGINLADAKQYEYAVDTQRALEINHYGRTITVGVKAKF